MQQTGLIVAELDTSTPHLADRARKIIWLYDRPALRVWHQPAWTEFTSQAPHFPHHIGSGDRDIEIEEVLLIDSGDQVISADEIRASFTGGLSRLALGEHQHTNRLTGAMRQRNR